MNRRAYWTIFNNNNSFRIKNTTSLFSACLQLAHKRTFKTGLRSHNCSLFNEKGEPAKIREEVTVCGWLFGKRIIGNQLCFFPLRDRYNQVQCIVGAEDGPIFERVNDVLKNVNMESVLQVKGVIRERPEKDINKDSGLIGQVEIHISDIKVISDCPILPFPINDKEEKANEELRLSFRYLDLRRSEMQRTLRIRADAMRFVRSYFDDQGFLEVETPILFKSTPEGAREFLVPSRTEGYCYALPQSPQQYKQILMMSGVDRYYQLAKCFRDEDLSSDKQPEFTQIDMEMSFVQQEDVMRIMEGLVKGLWERFLDCKFFNSFPSFSYEQVINKYGIDKPDIRFDLPILSEIDPYDSKYVIEAFPIKPEFTIEDGSYKESLELSKKSIKSLITIPKTLISASQGVLYSGIWEEKFKDKFGVTFDINPGTPVVISKRLQAFNGAMTISGFVRRQLITEILRERPELTQTGGPLYRNYRFLWVQEFPLFKECEEAHLIAEGQAYESMHHPFTAPRPEYTNEKGLLPDNADPLKIRAQHYDLVVNGVELGGGSIRIHNAGLQTQVIKDILSLNSERLKSFDHLLKALKYGCPPHGGMALGFDRLICFLVNAKSVRDVIAFPKSSQGKDLMISSPSPVTELQSKVYNIILPANLRNNKVQPVAEKMEC